MGIFALEFPLIIITSREFSNLNPHPLKSAKGGAPDTSDREDLHNPLLRLTPTALT
jgi:hypothetical protein